jgi:hypothetical protein
MAKQPNDRYQTVGELVEDLTIASGIEASQVTPVPTSAAAANRIVVQTKTAVPSGMDAADLDEVTVVRQRLTTSPGTDAYAAPALPAPTGVSPWKILLPALAGLIVVFAVVYAVTREAQPSNANQAGPALVADPNSQAVEPSPPATGSAEQGIPAGGVINPQPDANVNVNANANANANVEASPTPDLNVNAEANTNANENANTNSNRPVVNPPLPSPSRPANANENPTAPPPDDKKAPSPKPTQAATADAPPA